MGKHTVQIDVDYLGDLSCQVTHVPSGNSFFTDAPLDNNGQARYISPTDLAGASIAACISTIMGIKAEAKGIDIKGMKVSVVKEMVSEPTRRIGKFDIVIRFPHKLNDKDFQLLSNVVKTCPVSKSLAPEVDINFKFEFAE